MYFGFYDCSGFVAGQEAGDEDGDGLDWLRRTVPGEPGLDYPVLSSPQQSDFTCDGLALGGYYADPAQDCQASSLKSCCSHYSWINYK